MKQNYNNYQTLQNNLKLNNLIKRTEDFDNISESESMYLCEMLKDNSALIRVKAKIALINILDSGNTFDESTIQHLFGILPDAPNAVQNITLSIISRAVSDDYQKLPYIAYNTLSTLENMMNNTTEFKKQSAEKILTKLKDEYKDEPIEPSYYSYYTEDSDDEYYESDDMSDNEVSDGEYDQFDAHAEMTIIGHNKGYDCAAGG